MSIALNNQPKAFKNFYILSMIAHFVSVYLMLSFLIGLPTFQAQVKTVAPKQVSFAETYILYTVMHLHLSKLPPSNLKE